MTVQGFTFTITCPDCAGPVVPLDHLEHAEGPRQRAATLFCPACCTRWLIRVSACPFHLIPPRSGSPTQRARDRAAQAIDDESLLGAFH